MKQNLIQDKSFKFALTVIRLYKEMASKNEYILSKQLLRSGTSIGANVEEAIAGQSRKDFISKMNIALKESRETIYWLRLLNESKIVNIDFAPSLRDSEEVCKIITAIVKSTRENTVTTP